MNCESADDDIQTNFCSSSVVVLIVLVSNEENSVSISLATSVALMISALSVMPL